MSDDTGKPGNEPAKEPTWISSLPFPRHWLYYIALKLVVLAIVVYVVLRNYGLV